MFGDHFPIQLQVIICLTLGIESERSFARRVSAHLIAGFTIQRQPCSCTAQFLSVATSYQQAGRIAERRAAERRVRLRVAAERADLLWNPADRRRYHRSSTGKGLDNRVGKIV